MEHSKELYYSLGIKREREESVSLGLGDVEVGLPDRRRNPKPRTKLLLERKGGYEYSYPSLLLLISFHSQTQQEVRRKKARVTLVVVNFSIKKHRADETRVWDGKFVGCGRGPVSVFWPWGIYIAPLFLHFLLRLFHFIELLLNSRCYSESRK